MPLEYPARLCLCPGRFYGLGGVAVAAEDAEEVIVVSAGRGDGGGGIKARLGAYPRWLISTVTPPGSGK